MLRNSHLYQLLLQPERFISWLYKQDPFYPVGRWNNWDEHPITCWLFREYFEAGHTVHVEVGLGFTNILNSGIPYEVLTAVTPPWIRKLDHCFQQLEDFDVTAYSALEAMAGILGHKFKESPFEFADIEFMEYNPEIDPIEDCPYETITELQGLILVHSNDLCHGERRTGQLYFRDLLGTTEKMIMFSIPSQFPIHWGFFKNRGAMVIEAIRYQCVHPGPRYNLTFESGSRLSIPWQYDLIDSVLGVAANAS